MPDAYKGFLSALKELGRLAKAINLDAGERRRELGAAAHVLRYPWRQTMVDADCIKVPLRSKYTRIHIVKKTRHA